MFIMIDGIDGSGKSTVVHVWKDYLKEQGKTIFDLKDYQKEFNRYPDFTEANSCDFIFSHEPSSAGIGKVIREEFIRNNTDYPAYAIAEAYALDRLIIYKKMIVPALAENEKIIISDRAVCTSLCYQHILDPKNLTFDVLAKIPGNAFTLKYPPQHLILMDIAPDKAFARISGRVEKNDNAIFEKLDFLKKAAGIYRSEEYQRFFTKLGTKIHYLNAETEIDIMKQEATELLKQLINQK